MKTLDKAVVCDDQPIGNRTAATMFHEARFLSSWIDPKSLEVQDAYKSITSGFNRFENKVVACWDFVKRIPYHPFVPSRVTVGGVSYSQDDAWLDPGQTLRVGYLNCFNKSILLASLLRQEFPPEDIYVCLGNVQSDGIGGHAFLYLATGDYIMECTDPHLRLPFIRAEEADIYESVIFFNDEYTFCIPGATLTMPLGACCVRWLEDYISARHCHNYIA